MTPHLIKSMRLIEWLLACMTIILIVLAWFKADDDMTSAMVIGILALVTVLALNIVTQYLNKHE